MRKIKEAFKEILLVELDDLDEDIKVLIKQSESDYSNDAISNYVCMENLAVLQNELFGVEGFREEIASLDILKYASLTEMIDDIKNRLSERIKEKGLVPSIKVLVDRKIEKVKIYVTKTAV